MAINRGPKEKKVSQNCLPHFSKAGGAYEKGCRKEGCICGVARISLPPTPSVRQPLFGVPKGGCSDQGGVFQIFISWFPWFSGLLKILEFVVCDRGLFSDHPRNLLRLFLRNNLTGLKITSEVKNTLKRLFSFLF